ncbi:MAG: [Fe-Fe] hydrogenase large subunit C-terminal domain-containing protein [Melioribacteraceae bacterium]|nr:MAG: [Fe-Fe] hydrogenase large subunit C-terminal domain-containing protein [Melioribacteraceae bacterium]
MVGIVSTIGQRCKRCYSCVRECPATAIRVENGQAVVIAERCISCGHCVKVCSQKAKKILSDKERVLFDLIPSHKTIAIFAPSIAASFPEAYSKIPAALKKIGFEKVCETAFGADLVAKLYKEEFEKVNGKTIISSPCPAVNNYIEKYFVDLVPHLAKIVSPMIAMGRYLKETEGNHCKVVFVGPCVAKKSEYIDPEVENEIDAVLTFTELKEIFDELKIDLTLMEDQDFDPPYANFGKSFPLTGGLLKTAEISSDVLARNVIVVDGKEKVVSIIKDISENKIKSKFVDILFCEGCINGPAIDTDLNYYSRREKVVEFIDKNLQNIDKRVWKCDIYNSRHIDFTRNFHPKSQRRPMPSEEKIKEILSRTNKIEKKDELNCGACGYPSCREYAIAIAKDLAEEDMCLPYLIEKLENAYTDLKQTQEQLQSAEKLASIGQLAAGVAHEINNPLGTIILYAAMLKREVESKKCNVTNPDDYTMIIDEANRCKNIVSNLLNFARHGKLKITSVNLPKIIDEIVRSIKINPSFKDVILNINNNCTDEIISADPDQIKQVFLNVITNGCEALEESEIKNLTINLRNDDTIIITEIIDTGCGIPEENMKKLFTPFFTTKKMGKGTGLGLAITYGIIKMHRGDIAVKSNQSHGSIFTIKLPLEKSEKRIMMN